MHTVSQPTSSTGIASASSPTPAIGRALLAAIFLVSGAGKLANPSATIAYIGSSGAPLPELGYLAALVAELAGGALLLVGYRVRPVAAILALFSVASALLFHHALTDHNQLFHFLKNVAMAGGLLQVVAFGAGAYSVDARRGR